MAGQSRNHMKAIAPLGALARWPNGPLDLTENGIKARARAAVKRAMQSGRLVKPANCTRCGDPERLGSDGRSLIHAHHYLGYSHPLDVEWLCVKCHFQDDERPKGEKNGRAKIDLRTAREIRLRYCPRARRTNEADSANSLAREFGISPRTVWRIIRNEIWIDASPVETP